MIWVYVGLFFVSLLMGIFDVPQWMFLLVFIPYSLAVLYLTLFPVIFEKNPDKIMNYLKKSKHPHYQFTYHFFNDEFEAAEKDILKIRSKQLKTIDQIILMTRQDRFAEAKSLLPKLKDNMYKWYYSAVIALGENDLPAFNQYKGKVKDGYYQMVLEIEEKVHAGKILEAKTELEELMKRQRGLKLISALMYKKDLERRR